MTLNRRTIRSSTFFALCVGAAFLVAGLIGIFLINRQEKEHALQYARQSARIILDRNLATHTFFTKELKPGVFFLSEGYRSGDYFDPAWMSSTYAIRQIDKYFRELGAGEYYYKECAIDARSPENEADPIERAFIEEMERNPNVTIRSEVRTIAGKPYFVVMRRGEMIEAACMLCHSRPEYAPGGMLRLYGEERGFGRKIGAVGSAISLRIPLSEAYASADALSYRLSAILVLLFLVLYAVQYALGRWLLFAPIEAVRDKALQIATDERHLGEMIRVPVGREIQELAGAFNEMSTRLRNDRNLLEEHVRDRTAEIVDINKRLEIDLEERLRIEGELKKSEARLRAVFEGASIGIALVDTKGRLVETNHVLEEYLGYSKEELGGMTFRDITHADDVKADQDMYEELWEGKRTGYRMEKRYVRKDGGVVWGRKSVSLVRGLDDRVRFAINMVEDITERKRYEEELLNARKLEALGVLAGGIAHDFNNYLTAILGNISILKMLSSPGEKSFERLEEAENAALRAKALSGQLITFAKGGAPVRKTASLKELVEESARFVLRGSNVKCSFSFSGNLWSAEVDEGQIGQVLNHLIMNADQAMPEGGVLEIGIENCLLGAENFLNARPGRYLRILVRDRGIGIRKDDLSRIFDPYFTTKPGSSGLGLTTAHAIVSKHDGHLCVDSIPGKGSTFTIYLPASERGIEPAAEGSGEPARGGGRILVMDDEEMVRNVSREMLQLLGYEVATAVDGREAIDFYRKAMESGSPFDAVLMDLTVPGGMGGEEAIRKLLEIDPGIVAVVSSGYSDNMVMANHREFGFHGVITKPYKVADLADTLKKAIESGRSR